MLSPANVIFLQLPVDALYLSFFVLWIQQQWSKKMVHRWKVIDFSSHNTLLWFPTVTQMKENYIVPFLCTGDESREYMLKGTSENTVMTASYDS